MGLLRMAARTAVVAGTATAVSGRVARRQAERYDQRAAQAAPAPEPVYAEPVYAAPAYAAPPPAAAPAAPSEQDAQVARLQSLADLHAQGVLSDEEFAAAKAKALGL